MSKRDEDGGFQKPETPVETSAARAASAVLTVEDHAKALGISAPVFAAVRQAWGWAAGKKVSQSDFEKAVNGFLNAPMGGGK
jgi:hypothetical protein